MEKKKARDLRQDKEKLRDISLMPFGIIMHSLKTSARQEKDAIYEEKTDSEKLLDELQKAITALDKKQPITPDVLKNISADLKKFEEDIKKEFMNAVNLEDTLVILSFRMKNMNRKAFEMLHKLVEEGFPEEFVQEETEKEKAFIAELEEEDRQDYRFAREIYSAALHAQ